MKLLLTKKAAALFSATLLSICAHAQTGRISGAIIDGTTGETLPGTTIRVEGTTLGAAADFDGRFVINQVPVGEATIIVSCISYKPKRVTGIRVVKDGSSPLIIKMESAASDSLDEVVITTTLSRDNNVALALQQKENASVSDGVSSEIISRSSDKNGSDVLKRVSGVTMLDDKYVVVRGLNERYNASYLNGAPLPSTEADKKAFSFDLFPSNMLDNIIVNKTATPDMPSEFAGGIIQVNTKGIPEKNFLMLSASSGLNTITTGKSRILYAGGELDKLGFDDGTRDLPGGVPALADKDKWISNDNQAKMASLFPNNWAYSNGTYMPNGSYQIATGYNFKRKQKDFIGLIFSAGLSNTKNLYTLERSEYDGMRVADIRHDDIEKERNYKSTVHQDQNSAGMLLNLSAKLNDNNTITFKNLFSGTTDNRFVSSYGTNNLLESERVMNRVNTRYFSANRIFSSQLAADHFIEKIKLKIQWNAGYSNVNRTVPDFRVTSYSRYERFREFDPAEGPNRYDTTYRADISSTTGPGYSGYRVYNGLTENMTSAKLDVSRLFKLKRGWKADVKSGMLIQMRSRDFEMRSFGLNQYSAMSKGIYRDDSLLYLPEDKIFASQNMGVTSMNTGGFKVFENTKEDDNYRATSGLYAAYAQGEFRYSDKFRAITGARIESYSQLLTVSYRNMDSVYVASTVNDILPSVNLIYNLNDKTAIRMAYYKTLNRPEFRELAKVNWFDPETRLSVAGSPDLVRAYIHNADARFEYYPGRGQLFTVSGFYKYFNAPIERYMMGGQESQIIYRNANFAHVYGTEMEFRVIAGAILKKDSSRFLSNLSIFSNLSLIRSIVNVSGINSAIADTREMQGQAPYVINTGVTYADKKRGYGFTVMMNRVGPRIYIVGNDQVPDRWENARTVVDLQATKTLLKKKLEIRLGVKDILAQQSVIYFKGNARRSDHSYKANTDFVNFSRNFGSTWSLLVSYRF